MKTHIRLLDTTLTEGFNSAGVGLMIEDKLVVARLLANIGVDIIEAGYPSRSAADFAAVQAISQSVVQSVVAARSKLWPEEIDLACSAVRQAVNPRVKITAPTSPMFLRFTLQMDEPTLLEKVRAAVTQARNLVPDVQFTAEDASRTDWGFLSKVLAAAIDAGAQTVVVQDSVGIMTPKEFYDIVRYLRDNTEGLDRVALGVDCRHDLGMALANALGAVERGVDQTECTAGGIGFPLGHVPLEMFVTALRTRYDRYRVTTGVPTDKLHLLSDVVHGLTGTDGVIWGKVLREPAISRTGETLVAAPELRHEGALALDSFRLMTNESGDCLAEVSIVTAAGTQYEGRAEGINQIETIHRAIASGLGVSVKLLDHTVNHIRQDCKEVLICLEDGHQVVNGRASANTVLRASAEAYVDALRKLSVSSN